MQTGNTQEQNPEEWIREYELRYRQTYLDLLRTIKLRTKQHDEALKALQEAVDMAKSITLDFVETQMEPKREDGAISKEDSTQEI